MMVSGCASLVDTGIVRATTVVLVDDHPVFTEALSVRLDDEPDIRVVGVSSAPARIVDLVEAHRPDVLVLDVGLGAEDGIELMREVRSRGARPAVVILTSHDDVDTAERAMRGGASGFVRKVAPVQELAEAIRWAARGEVWVSPPLLTRLLSGWTGGRAARSGDVDRLARLSDREHQVLQLMVDGLAYAAIAARLNLSVHTVRTHAHNLQSKLGAHSNLAAVSYALAAGIRPTRGGAGSAATGA